MTTNQLPWNRPADDQTPEPPVNAGDEVGKPKRGKSAADRVAVENFLASLAGMSITDAFANARADGKSYGWGAPTQNAVAEGISRHFARTVRP